MTGGAPRSNSIASTAKARRRIARLASKLNCDHSFDADDVARADPGIPTTMLVKAIERAISDCEQAIAINERWIADRRTRIDELQRFRSDVLRGTLRVVHSRRDSERDGGAA